jgi:hemolysin III
MFVQKSDQINFFSHLIGLLAMVAGYIVLLVKSAGSVQSIVLSTVYSLCAIFIFTCSSVYHGQKREEDLYNPWRRLDHIAIFFMIAGTYTPICYVYLDVYWRWSIIGAQWLLVLLGLFFKLFYIQGPRWLTVLIYVLMGWMVIIPLYQLLATVPAISLWLLLAGGVAYTVGGLIYALKKPNPVPGFFGFHEIFHLLILLGAALHYFVIYIAIAG